MTASRRKPRARWWSAKKSSSSGPRCAMRMVAWPTHSVSGPAPSARARQPVIPHMRAAKTIGVPECVPRPAYCSLSTVRVIWISCWKTSLGLEPDPAVEADHLGVHVVVLDQHADQMAEFIRPPHPLGEHN